MYGFKKQLLKKTTFLAIAIFAFAGVPSKLKDISHAPVRGSRNGSKMLRVPLI